MHSPEYVLEKAQNRYRSVWRDALLDADSGVYAVALDPPSAAAITDRAGEVSAWLSSWREWAVQHPEATLRTRIIRTKFGALDHPGNLGGSDSWKDAGPWRHRGSTRRSSASAR